MQALNNGHSVVAEPPKGYFEASGDIVIQFATAADDMYAWGAWPRARDRQLRAFWPTEPMLASAITSTAAKYAAFGWSLDGPERTVRQVQRILNWVEDGQGWSSLIVKVALDLFSQDNGAFVEIVRAEDNPYSPVVTLNHLDSNRCVRTGRREEPVIYYDIKGGAHMMKWYQVIPLAEMPSPIETMRGVQYCTVTRLLRAAQIMRDISIYEKEKIGGRFNRAIHLVGGVTKKAIEDALAFQRASADNQGLIRYLEPLIISSLDPTSQVSLQTIEIASLPDHFSKETEMKWFINQLALAFATDYQEFAPLPAGNLGSSQQSQVLHLKSRGKGPALFMKILEHAFNFYGVMPETVTFRFGDQDSEEDLIQAQLRTARANLRAIQITSGEITPEVARQMAVDAGDLKKEYLHLMGEEDATTDVIANDTRPVPRVQPVIEGEPGPTAPPSAGQVTSIDNNDPGASNDQPKEKE